MALFNKKWRCGIKKYFIRKVPNHSVCRNISIYTELYDLTWMCRLVFDTFMFLGIIYIVCSPFFVLKEPCYVSQQIDTIVTTIFNSSCIEPYILSTTSAMEHVCINIVHCLDHYGI